MKIDGEMKTNSKLKVNDNVIVITGSDRGRKGKILKIDRKKGRVIVEGVNKKNKNMRATQENPKGGKISIEFPIAISNVLLFCDKCKKGTRIGVQQKDKTKSRVCRACGKSID
ncbi:MAG: 50S ribosomal protein L24 [Spirochaetes bacterium]|nr:50S ribosomal protein L24 [Spirochaetota bacterium]